MGLFVKYFHYTVIIAMVSYQYFSYLYYYDMHQCRYICCYFTLTYDDSVIYIMFHLKLSQSLFFLTNIEYVHLCYFKHNNFAADKEIHYFPFLILRNKCIY